MQCACFSFSESIISKNLKLLKMASSSSRGRKRSQLTEAEELEQSFPTLNWQQIHSMCMNPPPLPAQVEGRVSFLSSATVMPPSTPDNPSIEDFHNSELVNRRWRLEPAVVEKRLLQKSVGIKEKRVLARLTGTLGPDGLPRVLEKTLGKRNDLETNKEKLEVSKLNTPECSKDLSQKMEVDGNPGEAQVMFSEEEGRVNVVEKLVVKKVKTKKILIKKVKIMKPARSLDRRNHNQSESYENTGNSRKTDEQKLGPECLEKGKLLSEVEAMEVSEGVFWYQGQEKTFLKKPSSKKCGKKAEYQKDIDPMLENSKAHQNKKVFKANKIIKKNISKIQRTGDKKKGGKAENKEGICVGVGPYHCKECEKKFSRKDSLNRHLLVVHRGVKLHQCQKCNMKFERKEDLKVHLVCLHGGKKLFPCTEQDCSREFAVKGKLLNHLRKKHSCT